MQRNDDRKIWNDTYRPHLENKFQELPWTNQDFAEFEKVINDISFPKNARILDIGVGNGETSNILSKKGNVHAIDISNVAIKLVKQKYADNPRIAFATKNFSQISLKKKYDFVSCHLTIHQVNPQEIDTWCKNIATLAKDGFSLSWLKSNSNESSRPSHCVKNHNVYHYSMEEIKQKFQGFDLKTYPDVTFEHKGRTYTYQILVGKKQEIPNKNKGIRAILNL